MKFKLKIALVMLAGITLFYTACKKSSEPVPVPAAPTPSVIAPAPGTSTVEEATVSSLIAINIAQTLAGNYGGINLANGIIEPAYIFSYNTKPIFGTTLPDLCSFSPDTIARFSSPPGDTVKSITSGISKFYFNCDTVKGPRVNGYVTFSLLNGYNTYDSLATRGVAPKDSFTYNIKEFLEARATDTVGIPLLSDGSANKLLIFNGDIKSFVDITAATAAVTPSSLHVYYTLNNLTVDLTQSTYITGGTATFGANGTTNKIPWYYAGTIKFLGNNKVSITINTLTYNVDMVTGTATAM